AVATCTTTTPLTRRPTRTGRSAATWWSSAAAPTRRTWRAAPAPPAAATPAATSTRTWGCAWPWMPFPPNQPRRSGRAARAAGGRDKLPACPHRRTSGPLVLSLDGQPSRLSYGKTSWQLVTTALPSALLRGRGRHGDQQRQPQLVVGLRVPLDAH